MMMMNHNNNKRLCKRSKLNHQRLNKRNQRLSYPRHSNQKILVISRLLLLLSQRPEVALEVAVEVKEEAAVVPEVAEAREEKAKKAEADSAVAEAAVEKEEAVKKVAISPIDQEVAVEEAAEAEVEDPSVKKVLALKAVMKVFSTSKERKRSTMLARTNTSRVREANNITHMTEDPVLAEAEKLPRAVTERATSARLKTKSSTVKKSLVVTLKLTRSRRSKVTLRRIKKPHKLRAPQR